MWRCFLEMLIIDLVLLISGSESNHFSTSCPSTKLKDETFIYAQNVEEAKVHESPIRENIFRESPIWDNNVWESPIWDTHTTTKTAFDDG